MASFSYVHIVDIANKSTCTRHFRKISDAVSFVKSFPCKGHFVYACLNEEVICTKSDVEMNFGYHYYERSSKGLKCVLPDVSKTDINSKSQLWSCSCRP